ncbi:MAG: DUF2505 family protein [Deltaproteobacteria bacterium]|nr:DUF2505 family protein [Deltaproteobacteria bacterium]
MNFEVRHTFDCDIATYERLFLDPGVANVLKVGMRQMQNVELLEHEDKNGAVKRKVRYTPVPGHYKVGPKTVPAHWAVITEESLFDRARHTMQFKNTPNIPAMLRERFHNTGRVELRDAGNGKTERVISGEIVVKIFLLGKIAERIIHKYGVELLDEEARVMQAHVLKETGKAA